MIPYQGYMENEFSLAKHFFFFKFQIILQKHVLKKIIKLGESMV
jgi:hypothetical protein